MGLNGRKSKPTPVKKTRRKKTHASGNKPKVVILSALAYLLCLIAIEGVTRLLVNEAKTAGEILIPDPLLHHRYAPNLVYHDNFRSVPQILRTNSQSWVMDYEVSKAKPPGTYRIVYVGDSNTACVVERGKKMVDIIERKLNEIYQPRGVKIEIVNAGTSSHATGQYYINLKNQLLDFSPDLVVINLDMSDIPDDFFYRKMTKFDDKGAPLAILPNTEEASRVRLTPFGTVELTGLAAVRARLSSFSAFFRFLEREVLKHSGAVSGMEFRHMVIDASANWLAKNWTPAIEESVNRSMNTLRMTIELLRSRGVKVLVNVVPYHGQFIGELSTKPHEVVMKTARNAGVPVLSGYEALKEKINGTPQDRYFWNTDPMHLNIEGNAIWAEAQLAVLLDPKNQLLP